MELYLYKSNFKSNEEWRDFLLNFYTDDIDEEDYIWVKADIKIIEAEVLEDSE